MKKILFMSLVSTTGMTIFSYLMSGMFKEKFLETALLNQVAFPEGYEKKKHNLFGIVVHYLVGLFFSRFYYMLWTKTPLKPDAVTSSMLGFINGVIGVSGWHATFLLHPKPPDIDFKKYYLQLLAAHIVFGYLNGLVFGKNNLSGGRLKETS